MSGIENTCKLSPTWSELREASDLHKSDPTGASAEVSRCGKLLLGLRSHGLGLHQ